MIKARIEKGRELLQLRISTDRDLAAARNARSIWSKYNSDMLAGLFDQASISQEYSSWIGVAVARRAFADRVSDYRADVEDSIARLQSILERLELFRGASEASRDAQTSGEIGTPPSATADEALAARSRSCLVFISHLSAERDMALALQASIQEAFPNITVFVSSDPSSIWAGDRWLDQITEAMTVCDLQIIVASPASVSRAWINFEAGAEWLRRIPVVPLCHSGMTPGALPLPLSLFQGGFITEPGDLDRAFRSVARACGSGEWDADLQQLAAECEEIEQRFVASGTSTLPAAGTEVRNRSIPELRALSAERRSLEREFYDKTLELQTFRAEGRRASDSIELSQALELIGTFWSAPAQLSDADIANGIVALEAVIEDLRNTPTPDIRATLLREFYDHDLKQATGTTIDPLDLATVSERLQVSRDAVQRRLRELLNAGLVEGYMETFGESAEEGHARITEAGRRELERHS